MVGVAASKIQGQDIGPQMQLDVLLEKIEARYAALTPRLRQAARFVTQEPTTVALSPLRRVAESAGVSPTTLIRLATTLGFESYEEFREPFRQSLRPGSQRYSGAATQLVDQKGSDAFKGVFQRAGETLVAQLEETYSSISVEEMEAAGKVLLKARNIYVLGLRSCFAASFYFAYAASSFRDNICLIDGQKGMLIDDFVNIGPKDVLLVLSFDPYPIDTVRTVKYARTRGAAVIAITDNRLSPIARHAKHAFLVPASSSSFYTSLVPAMALLEGLISILLMQSGKSGVDRIRERFALLEEHGIYWDDRSEIT